jgi:hypothetical protein
MFQGSPNTQVHYNTKCPSGVIKTQGESANRISAIEMPLPLWIYIFKGYYSRRQRSTYNAAHNKTPTAHMQHRYTKKLGFP